MSDILDQEMNKMLPDPGEVSVLEKQLVMDDILVTFDEYRARRTLEVLAEFSEHAQVLLLTCHRRTVELYRDVQPATPVIELGPISNSDAAVSSRTETGEKKSKRSRRKRRPTEPDDPVLFPAT